MSRLGKQIAEVLAALERIDARYARIGGLALASHNTQSSPTGRGVLPAGAGTPDPYEILDDLMCVVEGLCPRRPSRPIEGDGARLLL